MGRVIAWKINTLVALDHPATGAGFRASQDLSVWLHYARDFSRLDFVPTDPPDPVAAHAAHSIYFQVLGDHGFVGLGLFLLFWALTWRTATWVRRNAQPAEDLRWAGRLASMAQVSLVGYFVGGAFLSLAYFDLPYDLMVVMVLLKVLVRDELKAVPSARPAAAGSGARTYPEPAHKEHSAFRP